MFHCVKNQGTSRIFRCVRGLYGFTVEYGILTTDYAPVVIADTKEEVWALFAYWQAGTFSVVHPEELRLIATNKLNGNVPIVPMDAKLLRYRIKTGVYSERQSEGYEPTSDADAYAKCVLWTKGLWDADIPDADEREFYRDRPFNGVSVS